MYVTQGLFIPADICLTHPFAKALQHNSIMAKRMNGYIMVLVTNVNVSWSYDFR